MSDLLIISNMGEGDDVFESDVGSWNVSRARRGCEAGRHRLYRFPVHDTFEACKNVSVDADKVASMVADTDHLLNAPPVIFAVEGGKAWLIDGHHRVTAMFRAGVTSLSAYVVEETDLGAGDYKIWYNGQRVAPWHEV